MGKIKDNLYVSESDEGLLEIKFEDYEDCYFVDVPGVMRLLDTEHARLEGELTRARNESTQVVDELDSFLKENHQKV